MEYFRISDILHAFERYDGEYKDEAVDAAISRKDDITPHLLRILEDVLAHPENYTRDDDRFDHIYALLLLGHFRETAAHPLVIELFSQPGDRLNALYGDIWLAYLPNILVATCGGSLDRIKAMAENREVYIYVRASALHALAIAYPAKIADRLEILSYYESLFTRDKADEDSEFWSFAAMNAADLYPQEIMATIERAFQEDLINRNLFSLENLEKTLAKGPEECRERLEFRYRNLSLDDIHAVLASLVSSDSDSDFWEDEDSEALDRFGSKESGAEQRKTLRKKKQAAKKKRKMANASKRKNRR